MPKANNLIDLMKFKQDRSPNVVMYDSMMMPYWTNYIHPMEVEAIYKAITSARNAGNPEKRLKAIKTIMERNGFKRIGGGTNRIVYRFYEDPSIVAKVALDKVGLTENLGEFTAQEYLKPFCAKMFYCTPKGTIGFSEKVIPITNIEEFKAIAEDVVMILITILSKYLIEDAGTKYFMNWGVRPGFGPVLLDYPSTYPMDPDKLHCKRILLSGEVCGGFIDYDDGLNNLYCTRCGQTYEASSLASDKPSNNLIRIDRKKGKIPMKVSIVKNGEVIKTFNDSSSIRNPHYASNENTGAPKMVVKVMRGDEVLMVNGKKAYDGALNPDALKPRPEHEPLMKPVKARLVRGDEDITPKREEPVEEENTTPINEKTEELESVEPLDEEIGEETIPEDEEVIEEEDSDEPVEDDSVQEEEEEEPNDEEEPKEEEPQANEGSSFQAKLNKQINGGPVTFDSWASKYIEDNSSPVSSVSINSGFMSDHDY